MVIDVRLVLPGRGERVDEVAARFMAFANELAADLGGQAIVHTYLDELGVVPSLTPRQLEILSLVDRGFQSKEIASSLDVSRHTVDNHISATMRAMG